MKSIIIFGFLLILCPPILHSQEISDIYLNQSLNVSINSAQMKILDDLMVETGRVFPVFARPITQREWQEYVSQTLLDRTYRINDAMLERIDKYLPDFKYQGNWHTELYGRAGLESVHRDNQNTDYITRYEERTPLMRMGFQASRDTMFGFAIQLKLQNIWPIYTLTDNQTNLPKDVRQDLDFRMFHKAYFSYQTQRMTFQFGRDNLSWGVGDRSTLMLSDNVPYYDFVKFVLWFTKVKFSMLYASLTDYEPQGGLNSPTQIAKLNKPYRSMMVQRVEWNMIRSLSVGMTYTKIIFGRLPDLGDINPFIFQHNLFKDYQNSLASIDAVWGIVPGIQMYGELISDEIKASNDVAYDNTIGPTTVSYQGGIKARSHGFAFVGEYVFLAPYMYDHLFTQGRAVDPDGVDYSPTKYRDITYRAIGHWLPPDSRNIYFSLGKEFTQNISLTISAEQRRKGEVDLLAPYPQRDTTVPASPTGIVQQSNILGISPKFTSETFDIFGTLYLFDITNYHNIAEYRKRGWEIQAAVSCRIF